MYGNIINLGDDEIEISRYIYYYIIEIIQIIKRKVNICDDDSHEKIIIISCYNALFDVDGRPTEAAQISRFASKITLKSRASIGTGSRERDAKTPNILTQLF